jgi:secreted Zn-dependent insulinase-like peptidase
MICALISLSLSRLLTVITLDKLRAFIPRLLSQLTFEVLVLGNVSRQVKTTNRNENE